MFGAYCIAWQLSGSFGKEPCPPLMLLSAQIIPQGLACFSILRVYATGSLLLMGINAHLQAHQVVKVLVTDLYCKTKDNMPHAGQYAGQLGRATGHPARTIVNRCQSPGGLVCRQVRAALSGCAAHMLQLTLLQGMQALL